MCPLFLMTAFKYLKRKQELLFIENLLSVAALCALGLKVYLISDDSVK